MTEQEINADIFRTLIEDLMDVLYTDTDGSKLLSIGGILGYFSFKEADDTHELYEKLLKVVSSNFDDARDEYMENK